MPFGSVPEGNGGEAIVVAATARGREYRMLKRQSALPAALPLLFSIKKLIMYSIRGYAGIFFELKKLRPPPFNKINEHVPTLRQLRGTTL
jgi:hypothetical protein